MTTFEQIRTMGKIKHSPLLFTASALAIGAFCLPARSQQIVADGVTVEVPADKDISTQAAGNPEGSALVGVNGGTVKTLGRVTLTTKGEGAHAAFSNGGTINLSGGRVTTTGNSAIGIFGRGGTLANNGDLTVRTAGNASAHGINIEDDGILTLKGRVDITTEGERSTGLLSDTSSKVTSGGPLTIMTEKNSSSGIAALAGSTVTLKDKVDITIKVDTTTKGEATAGLFSDASTVTSDGPLTIKTENKNSFAVFALNGGSVTLKEADIVTEGDGSTGLLSRAGKVTSDGPLVIQTSGNGNAHGIDIEADGTLTLNDKVDITTKGEGSTGLLSDASTVTAGGPLTIMTEKNGSLGIAAQAGSTVTLKDKVDITTKGEATVGLFSYAGKVTSDGPLTIKTKSNSSFALVALAGGTVTLKKEADIVTEGDGSTGLLSNDSTVRVDGPLSIQTAGNDHADGIGAQGGSTVTLNGKVDIAATGNGSYGLYSDASTVTAGGPLIIRTLGKESHGIVARNGGTVGVASGDIVTQGVDAAGIYIDFAGASQVSTASVSNGRLESAQGDLVRSRGGALDVTLDKMTTKNGSGLVLNVLDDASGNHGIVNFNAIDTGLTGNILAAAGNIANVSLAGSSLTGAAYNATNISLDAGSVWTMADSSTVSGTVTNAGTIAFAAPDAGVFRTLTTQNYIGDNGTVALNETLGADASPSDRIVIDGGAATGQTGLVVNNVAGPGASTTDGIKVVDAINGGTTSADAFFLGNGNYVTGDGQKARIAGAYAYTLNRSPISGDADVYGDSYAANDWYLRSVLTDPADPADPADPIAEPELPRYHPGVPVYETYPATLQILNRLPTLAQRMGDRYWREQAPAWLNKEQNAYYQDGAATIVTGDNVWGRVEGLHGRQQPDVTTSRADYDYDLWRFQAGIDGQLYESDAGKLIGGVNVHYGQITTDVSSFFGNGGIDTSGYGLGGTLTWYGNNGFYLDGQAQLTWYDSDLHSDTLRRGLADGNDGFGYALSLETGQRIGLNENWTLTPQAQLTWSSVDFDSFTDPYGARVSLDKGDSLKGRLGLALGHERSWKDGDGQTSSIQVYGIVNLTNEFLDGTRIDVSGTKFESRSDRLTGGIGLGGAYSWANNKYAIYGEVSADASLKNFADTYEVGGKLGLRVKF